MDNATDGFRSMTPYDYNGFMAVVFTVGGNGVLSINNVGDATLGLRPTISLTSEMKASGSGTATDPYVI